MDDLCGDEALLLELPCGCSSVVLWFALAVATGGIPNEHMKAVKVF